MPRHCSKGSNLMETFGLTAVEVDFWTLIVLDYIYSTFKGHIPAKESKCFFHAMVTSRN